MDSEGPSNVEKQIQENSNYFVILSLRMKPENEIIRRDYENNVTYRVQLFEKIFILWDNSSSITVQFGEYCCQSKMRNQGSADRDIIRLSRYLLELCLFLFTNKFADIFLRIPGKSNVLSHTRPFNSKIKKYFNLLLK